MGRRGGGVYDRSGWSRGIHGLEANNATEGNLLPNRNILGRRDAVSQNGGLFAPT